MLKQPTCYLSPRLEGRVKPDGSRGIFALQPVTTGDLLAVWGGEVLTGAQLAQLSADALRLSLQVEDDLYIVSTHEGPADWMNHSCDPNAGMQGQIVVVALRNIAVGEEVCFDYAMTDGSPYDEFTCGCGAANCRGRIRGDDWRRPELWERYAGHFSPYLQRRIKSLNY